MTGDGAPNDARQLMARALHELQRAQQRIAELERRDREPIAIVGAACRLPGGIGSPDELWQLLRAGGDATGPIPADRWDVERFFDPVPGRPGRIAARRGAFLDRIDGFDAAFFGIAPREAELMDPQQRLLLECSWHAFEDAGIAVDALRDVAVGTFVGISTVDYAYHLVQHVPPDEVTGHCGTGTAHAVAAGRIAYCLDLRGPCLALDTACSSSLVALHLACQSLRAGECELALVAGVNVMLSPLTGASFSHARMLAPDGRCKTFAADADGYARGEGVVALLLARAADAAQRGLRTRAEVIGAAVNQDGRSAGLTVPNGSAQAAVVRSALQQARIAPAAVDVVEAHGTGTPLGDPIELQALATVFGADRAPDRPLLVSSVKTNLGHTEAAAGLLAVLKATLQLQHGEVAPHLHWSAPNPHVQWQQLPLRVPTRLEPWPARDGGERRCAGVSSFGFSGTNAHVVLRSSAAAATATDAPAAAVLALPLAAADADALRELAARYRQRLAAVTDADARDLAFTAAQGRAALRVRAVALGRGAEGLRAALAQLRASAVTGDESDAALAARARSFVAGERVDFAADLRASARLVPAPLYPFQHRRHWCGDATAVAAPQLLLGATVPLSAAAARATTLGTLAVEGDLQPSLLAALRAAGCAPVAAGARAETWLFAAPSCTDGESTVAAVTAMLRWLQRAAGAAADAAPRRLLVLAHDDDAQAPVTAALRAAQRTARTEMQAMELGLVAAAPDADDAAVAAALLAPDGEDELVVRGRQRFGSRFVPQPGTSPAAPPLHADRSYLVTGGTGVLGRQLAAWLLRAGVRHLWLAARTATAVPAELAALAANGATVRTAAVEVGDRQAVDALVATIERSGPPLAGVFHLAGVVCDATLRTLAAADVRAQLAAKLLGAFHLHAATQHLALDAFVCFGSATAWLGNAGQAAYAASNGGLEGLCQWRRSLGLPAQTIAFGPWGGSGMAAAPAVQARLRAHGVRPLPPAAALAAFASARGVDAAAVAVVQVDWQQLARTAGSALPPRLRALARAGGATAAAAAPPRRAPLAADRLPAAIASVVAAVLGQPADAVAVDLPLASLGLDSLLATDLQHRLQQELGLQLGIGDLLAATDCNALAAFGRSERDAHPAPAPDDALAAFVANLSDDEVRAMLARDGRAAEPGAP